MSKTVIRLQATDYDKVPHLKGKSGVETEARNGDVTVTIGFRARDIVNCGEARFSLERHLQDIVDSVGFSNVAVRGRTNAYVSNMRVTGVLNTSPFTVKAGFSELSKSQILYLDKIKPGIVGPEHMRRLEDPGPIYNFQIPTTSFLFPEGHPASRAFEELAKTKDAIYDCTLVDRNDEATPHSKFMSTQIALYKGVTRDTLSHSCFYLPKNKSYMCTPTNSLMASMVRDNTSIFTYDQEDFVEGRDMIMTMPTSLAQSLRDQILHDATDLQDACMRDIAKITMNFGVDNAHVDWRYDASTDEIVSLTSSMRFGGDHEFFVRVRINMNALYVRITPNTVALTFNNNHIRFPTIWSSLDVRQNGKLRPGAKPLFLPPTCKPQVEPTQQQTKKQRTIDNVGEEEPVVAASSAPIVNDDDDENTIIITED